MTPGRSSTPAALPLQRLDERGARRGFANLLRKELATWTRTRSGWVQGLLWLGILNGLMTLPLVFMRDMFASEMGGSFRAAMDMFFNLGALAPYAGVVIMTHGAIIAERQLGTAAWVLSKPVARSAFILAKFVAFGLALLVLALTLPGIVAYGALSLEAGAWLDATRFAAGVGILALGLLWYLALTLMLGTLTSARGAVLAVPLVLLVVGDMLIMLWPPVAELGPWVLGRMAMLVAEGGPLLSAWPLLSTAIGTAAFLTVALWRFGREEF
jgi:ABC-2 type transport system permease protein